MKDHETNEYIYRNGWYRDKKTGRVSREYPHRPFITKDNWSWVLGDIYPWVFFAWFIFAIIYYILEAK